MAPEQTRDPTSVDARADLYALGCCLYFALTGKPPFPDGTIYGKVKAHRHEAPAPLRAHNPDVPEAFAAIVHRLLAKSPAERYASANELAAALAPFVSADVQPLETSNDAPFQEAVKKLIDGWTIPVAKETLEDAVLFRIEPEEKPLPMEVLSRSIFSDVDRIGPQVWVLVIVAAWVGLLVFCVLGTCLYSVLR